MCLGPNLNPVPLPQPSPQQDPGGPDGNPDPSLYLLVLPTHKHRIGTEQWTVRLTSQVRLPLREHQPVTAARCSESGAVDKFRLTQGKCCVFKPLKTNKPPLRSPTSNGHHS
uniref:Uncharacterized protein n=1 Tax=Eutreptiella gymnastica TaxID=73025 RepID=A0A7S4CDL0_9EUGL